MVKRRGWRAGRCARQLRPWQLRWPEQTLLFPLLPGALAPGCTHSFGLSCASLLCKPHTGGSVHHPQFPPRARASLPFLSEGTEVGRSPWSSQEVILEQTRAGFSLGTNLGLSLGPGQWRRENRSFYRFQLVFVLEAMLGVSGPKPAPPALQLRGVSLRCQHLVTCFQCCPQCPPILHPPGPSWKRCIGA